MDTQFTVTYQIIDIVTGEEFVTNEEYLARYHYENGDLVTENHITKTELPPYALTQQRVVLRWHDKDPEHNYHEPEEM